MFRRVFGSTFDWFWWLGFIGAIILVFIIMLGILENTWIVLTYGIGHMVLLTILGLKAISDKKSNMDIGESTKSNALEVYGEYVYLASDGKLFILDVSSSRIPRWLLENVVLVIRLLLDEYKSEIP